MKHRLILSPTRLIRYHFFFFSQILLKYTYSILKKSKWSYIEHGRHCEATINSLRFSAQNQIIGPVSLVWNHDPRMACG